MTPSEAPAASRDPHPPEPELRDRTKLDVARGLLTVEHRVRLGEAWHLFLNLLDRKPRGSAWVYGRRKVTISVLAIMEGVDDRTARAWLRRLEREGYVTVQRFPGYYKRAGIRIHISKAKDWIGGELRLLHEQKPRPEKPAA